MVAKKTKNVIITNTDDAVIGIAIIFVHGYSVGVIVMSLPHVGKHRVRLAGVTIHRVKWRHRIYGHSAITRVNGICCEQLRLDEQNCLQCWMMNGRRVTTLFLCFPASQTAVQHVLAASTSWETLRFKNSLVLGRFACRECFFYVKYVPFENHMDFYVTYCLSWCSDVTSSIWYLYWSIFLMMTQVTHMDI